MPGFQAYFSGKQIQYWVACCTSMCFVRAKVLEYVHDVLMVFESSKLSLLQPSGWWSRQSPALYHYGCLVALPATLLPATCGSLVTKSSPCSRCFHRIMLIRRLVLEIFVFC